MEGYSKPVRTKARHKSRATNGELLLQGLHRSVYRRKLPENFVRTGQLYDDLHGPGNSSKDYLAVQWRHFPVQGEDRSQSRRIEDPRIREVENEVVFARLYLLLA